MLGLKKKEHADINIFTIASGLLYEVSGNFPGNIIYIDF